MRDNYDFFVWNLIQVTAISTEILRVPITRSLKAGMANRRASQMSKSLIGMMK
jgi:hypothetical protein